LSALCIRATTLLDYLPDAFYHFAMPTHNKMTILPLHHRDWQAKLPVPISDDLTAIGAGKLSRNTLKHVKSVISGVFTLAKQQDYFQGENPARDSAINPKAPEPQEIRNWRRGRDSNPRYRC
jgi:hypothetical protein